MQLRRNLNSLDYLGILSIFFSLLIIPITLLDPALSGFLAWLAIVLGGLSNVGKNSRNIYPFASILVSFVSVFLLNIYTKSGIERITVNTVLEVFLIIIIPLLLAVFFIVIGFYRRRNAE